VVLRLFLAITGVVNASEENGNPSSASADLYSGLIPIPPSTLNGRHKARQISSGYSPKHVLSDSRIRTLLRPKEFRRPSADPSVQLLNEQAEP
jgi:hypothetical protein